MTKGGGHPEEHQPVEEQPQSNEEVIRSGIDDRAELYSIVESVPAEEAAEPALDELWREYDAVMWSGTPIESDIANARAAVEAAIRAPLEELYTKREAEFVKWLTRAEAAEEQLAAVTAERDAHIQEEYGWQGRALSAEAERDRLREALREISEMEQFQYSIGAARWVAKNALDPVHEGGTDAD